MNRRKILLIFTLASIPLFGYLFWHFSTPDTLTTNLSPYQKAGDEVKNSLSSLPTLPIQEEDERYTIEDNTKEGIQITYANKDDNTALAAEPTPETKPSLTLRFPKQYATEPIEVQIAEGKSILIQDKTAKGDYTAQPLSLGGETPPLLSKEGAGGGLKNASSWLQSLLGGSTSKLEEERAYLSYTDQSKRITTYYAYGHDQATGEKQLKNWQVYTKPSIIKGEQVAYSFTNAKLRKNDNGTISVYYYGDQELQNDKASAEVDPSLMARAQRTLAKEMGDSIDSGETPANFVIPKPYYINNNGDTINLDWRLSMDGKDISIDFTPDTTEYPLALDPTLSFTAPAMSNTGDVMTGETVGDQFGSAIAVGDFNSDGKVDLAVGANTYSSNLGRVYIFYQDNLIPSNPNAADVIITGAAVNGRFGSALLSGDFNSDGRDDLVVSRFDLGSQGGVYIFYNDGTYPLIASSADVSIAPGYGFGLALAKFDANSDGKPDLVGAAPQNDTVYIFYNDGSIPTTIGAADITITGSGYFGNAVATGDFNFDGKEDLAIGEPLKGTPTFRGDVYIFYNDGSIPTTAATADVTITGAAYSNTGGALAAGDFNSDGKIDLAVGAYNESKAYIFYNDGSYPATTASADVTITGSAYLGYSFAVGDFNADGRTDLATDAFQYNLGNYTGRIYIFYNDGSIPTVEANADVIITGEATNSYFSRYMTAADLNGDGRTDLAVGAYGYASSKGRAYIFYSQNGQVNTNQNITGNASGDYFGQAMTTGDFNADGRTDLAVGAYGYSTNTGRVYLFYGDGQIPTTAGTADVTITGEGGSFGSALAAGDLNADGTIDLVAGAYQYGSSAGRAYIFYNDGSIPTTAASADQVFFSASTFDHFGATITTGDWNADGRIDLGIASPRAVGGAFTGNVTIFYNDGSYSNTPDIVITGETTNNSFGSSLTAGDFNADGKTDLAVGASGYSTNTGRAYIFYSGSIITENASGADIIITGETTSNYFGSALMTGDFNTDGKTDLIVGAYGHSSDSGRAYIFYNGAITTESASGADVIITGETTNNNFGISLVAGDFNADGRIDFVVGATRYSNTYTGRAYIFYNDGVSFGSVVCTTGCLASNADVIITGETTNNYYGAALTAGDFNNDGRSDLVVGAYGYSTNTGRVYFYETRENFAWKLQALSPDTGGLRTGLSGTGQELKITGNSASDSFGYAMTTGDFNADGKTDLAVGAPGYSTNTGRVYIFYNDGTLSSGASGADVVITGEATNNYFGRSLTASDLNADGRTDLVAGAYGYSGVGRVYIFYNDGSISSGASGADVKITGNGSYTNFGFSLVSGDFNADGKNDLVVDIPFNTGGWSNIAIFYNTGTFQNSVALADVIMSTGMSSQFGLSMSAGDVNADGKTDLIVGDPAYSNGNQRVDIFYNDGSYPTNPDSADVIISGETNWTGAFGNAVTVGDFNADGKTDLAVSSTGYSSSTGRAYIFYNDGSYPAGALSADVIITGNASNDIFGSAMTSGDFNADGKTDLTVGAYNYSSGIGRSYIFYNDGSIPTTAATADVILTGEASSNYFGIAMTAGDLNADGRTDLIVGAYGYSGSKGRAYIYTLGNDPVITGETTNNSFGTSLVSGDFNADGKIDLAVGAYGYSTNTGRVYLFYQDGTIPSTATTADVIITGEASSGFGNSLTAGDLNADGKTDLVVGAYIYSSNAGRAYIFYNDGSIPTTAATADVAITGETGVYFGISMVAGDLNADGKTDIAIGGTRYASYTGRTYVFYADGTNNFGTVACTGSSPAVCLASDADVIITGFSAAVYFGCILVAGDFNSDGKTDLAAGGYGQNSNQGRAYIFYNGAITTENASGADVTMSGTSSGDYFGYTMTAGDINADGRTDLIVGAFGYSTNTGRAYIFYNDGSIPTTAATADVTITGETTNNYFGSVMTAGDLNADGKTDLIVGSYGYSTNTGRAYIFYNDGISFGTVACTTGCLATNADVTSTGETTSNYYGAAFTAGDFNTDGKTDLAIGAYGYSTSTGRVYLFTSEAKVDSAPPATARVRGVGKLRGTSTLR